VRTYLLALVLAVASAGLSQASSAATAGATVSKSAAPQQARALPDAQIERNIKAKLAKSKMAATEHFTVSVHNGVAVFEGKTNVIQHKGVATRMAKTSGAVAVQNNIQVSDAAKAKAAAKLAKYRVPATGPVRATVIQAAK
jgi:osmotically-inducible protein OsmY